MDKAEPIFHIVSATINTMFSPTTGTMIIRGIGINRTEVSLTTETIVNMTAAVVAITLAVTIIISGYRLLFIPASKFSMAIRGISHYNGLLVDGTPYKRETSTVSFHVIQHFSEIPFAFLFKIARHDLQSNIFH